MSGAVQNYLADATVTAAESLVEAFLRVPEEKRDWKPEETSRSARDLVTECALLNGYTAELVRAHVFAKDRLEVYTRDRAEAATQDIETVLARLRENTALVAEAIREVPNSDLDVPIALPWQTQPLKETIVYPYWNMTYHLGQINYIASLLGCLS